MTFDPIRNPSDDLAIAAGCHFDEAIGLRACTFVERFCKQSKGRWAGQPLQLLDWQRDFLVRLFGWRRPDGTRRFRSAYLEVAKKNGKSTLVSALTLYLLLADGEAAPEVYLNAVDREQAAIVFDEAARMVLASPELSARLKVGKYYGRITDPIGHGKIQKNSAEAPSKDGVNASGIIFDEVHRFKNRDLWDVFEYAGASREQPLRIAITTAGEEAEGVWYEQRERSERINDGAIPDWSHLGVVYRAFEEDDLDAPETWRKANPSLGVTIKLDDFAREWAEAKSSPAKRANFKRLRLNLVERAEGKFVDMAAWEACACPPVPDPDAPCWMGLDLSSRDDLTALVILSGDGSDGFDVECRFWLPGDIIVELERQHGMPYREWAQDGLIALTSGNTIDEGCIEAEIVRLASDRNLARLLVDPWQARRLGSDLLNIHGLPVEFLRQGYASLSEPTKALRDWIVSGRLRHGGHPILKWHASNAVARQDPAGNVKLDKGRSRNKKIDGMAALVNAAAGVIAAPEAEESVYSSRGILTI